MISVRALSVALGLWGRLGGIESCQELPGDGPIVARVTVVRWPRVGGRSLYLSPQSSSFSLLLPLHPGFFFPFNRVELCLNTFFFIPFFSSLHTGCRNHHPLEQRSPSFISTAPHSILSTPILDIEQTWETSFGTNIPASSLSLRVFVSPPSPSPPPGHG